MAREVQSRLRQLGYQPYVAAQVQNIPDLNRCIICELYAADFYIFINFRREQIHAGPPPVFRGSLYTNQELAIAYAIGIEKMIFLNQQQAERAGVFGAIVSNTPEFEEAEDILPILEDAIKRASWSPDFSRHLALQRISWTPIVPYGEHVPWEGAPTSGLRIRVLHGHVTNRRRDAGAPSVIAHLRSVRRADGAFIESPDSTPLKVTNQYQAYQQTIWPQSEGCFDLLALDSEQPTRIFLMSNNDVHPRRPITTERGLYGFRYEVLADGFPPLEFSVVLNVDGSDQPTAEVVP